MTLKELVSNQNNVNSEIWIVIKDSPVSETVYDVSSVRRYGNRIELIVDRSKLVMENEK